MAVGAFSLWQLAHFCCGSWRIFVVAIGAFLLWQLACFCCDSWRILVVAVGIINRLSFMPAGVKVVER